jgi:DNA-binding NarL/FixJ family response regulator
VTVRVLIADDEALVRSGIRLVLDAAADIEIVAEAPDGVEATRLARETRPDVALVDIRMPRVDGIEAVRRIVADPTLAATRAVVLTTFADDEYIVAAVRAGSCGFLLKSMPPEELIAAVRAVARGETTVAPRLIERLLSEYSARRPPPDSRLRSLTPRETDVLRLIARGHSNAEIARELFLGEGTVKTHVAALLRKLELRDRVQAAVAAYELGLVRPGS